MSDWSHDSLKLKKGHSWRAPTGYKIFVGDRGALRFNYPDDWVVQPGPDSINFHDVEPPDDNCRLACSYIRLPPIDWSDLPLSEMIKVATNGDERELTLTGGIINADRPDLEISWADFRFIDSNEKRPAFNRICIARGSNIQALITLDYWEEDEARLVPVWKEVIRSLELGRYIEDPTIGDVIN